MPFQPGFVLDWTPNALLVLGAAALVGVVIQMRRARLALDQRSRNDRVALRALVTRLFDCAQGSSLSPTTRIASLAQRTAVALDRSTLEIEDLLMAVWLRESIRAYHGMAVQAAAAPATFTEMMGILPGALDRVLAHPEPRIGRDPEDLLLAALPIAIAADERWDGAGPRALDGVRIPVGARILAVVECWDESLEGRPYRPAMNAYGAAELLAGERGLRFDPAVVHTFLRVVICGESASKQSEAA